MCGRFCLISTPETIAIFFGFNIDLPFEARYNIAPNQQILAVRQQDDYLEPALLRWGLIPSWAKEKSIGYKMINARSETLAEKPSFRSAYKSRRCLIPATGFFEWKKEEKSKQPYFIHRDDGGIFCFAGLWEAWTDKPSGEVIESCTIITTEANELMKPLHHRMPVIIPKEEYAHWTSCQSGSDIMKPSEWQGFEAYPVSTYVNSPKNEGSQCIAELN